MLTNQQELPCLCRRGCTPELWQRGWWRDQGQPEARQAGSRVINALNAPSCCTVSVTYFSFYLRLQHGLAALPILCLFRFDILFIMDFLALILILKYCIKIVSVLLIAFVGATLTVASEVRASLASP